MDNAKRTQRNLELNKYKAKIKIDDDDDDVTN